MLIKATRLHPGPLQSVMVAMVVAEVVIDGMVVVEAVVVVVVNLVEIVEVTTCRISFLPLSLSSIEGHC